MHARLFFSWFFPSLHALITPARFYFFPEFSQPANFSKITFLFFQPVHFEKSTKVIFTQWFDIKVMTKLTFFNVEVIFTKQFEIKVIWPTVLNLIKMKIILPSTFLGIKSFPPCTFISSCTFINFSKKIRHTLLFPHACLFATLE